MSDDAQALCEAAMSDGTYLFARVLPGSVAGLQRMLTTTALFLGVNRHGYETRYCFRDAALALMRLGELQSDDDVPDGWLARRPERPEDIAAKNRPGYLGGDPALASSWEEARDAETFRQGFDAMRQAPREGANHDDR